MKPNFLLINKPKNWTSHDVVGFVRNKLRNKSSQKSKVTHLRQGYGGQESRKVKVGHAGTLDPFATGLLIVGVGREATKRLDEFKNLSKTYKAVIKLGEVSDTQDSTGEILKQVQDDNFKTPVKKDIKKLLKTFLGKQEQIPPMYSAKKINGKKLYDLARAGKNIERKPVEIEIYKIKLIKYQWPYLTIRVKCSKGTYIRTLAHDIGQKLGVGAYCDELKRTKIGKHKVKIKDLKQIDKYIVL